MNGVRAIVLAGSIACRPEPDAQLPDDTEAPDAPEAPVVADVANFGDGRDLEVRLASGGADAYRIYVSAPGGPPSGTAFAEAAGAEAAAPITGGADAASVDGAPIVEGVPYVVYAAAVVGGVESEPSAPSATIRLRPSGWVRTITQVDAGTGGLEVDVDGTVLMGDFGSLSGGTSSRGVYRITPAGDVSLFAEGFLGASGNALVAGGDLMQSDIAAGLVARVTPDGEVSTHAAGLVAPGIAVDGDTLFVANCGDGSVSRIDGDGTPTTFASSPLLRCPNGIALADDGNLYVANFFDGKLLLVDPAGQVSVFATFPTNNLGHVTYGNGRLYVAVRGAHQIAAVSLAGEITTIAGSGERGADDGRADVATLSYPNDIALSLDGATLYFNDVHPDTADPNEINPVLVRSLLLPGDR